MGIAMSNRERTSDGFVQAACIIFIQCFDERFEAAPCVYSSLWWWAVRELKQVSLNCSWDG